MAASTPLAGRRVRAGHEHEIRVRPAVARRLEPVAHFFRRHDLLVRTVPATLGRRLILQVNPRRPGPDHLLHRARHAERVPPARVGVDEQRAVRRGAHPAHILQHVRQRRDAQIRPAVGRAGHPTARQVQRPKPGGRGHHRGVGVDRADDLQGAFGFEGRAQPGSGRVRKRGTGLHGRNCFQSSIIR